MDGLRISRGISLGRSHRVAPSLQCGRAMVTGVFRSSVTCDENGVYIGNRRVVEGDNGRFP